MYKVLIVEDEMWVRLGLKKSIRRKKSRSDQNRYGEHEFSSLVEAAGLRVRNSRLLVAVMDIVRFGKPKERFNRECV